MGAGKAETEANSLLFLFWILINSMWEDTRLTEEICLIIRRKKIINLNFQTENN